MKDTSVGDESVAAVAAACPLLKRLDLTNSRDDADASSLAPLLCLRPAAAAIAAAVDRAARAKAAAAGATLPPSDRQHGSYCGGSVATSGLRWLNLSSTGVSDVSCFGGSVDDEKDGSSSSGSSSSTSSVVFESSLEALFLANTPLFDVSGSSGRGGGRLRTLSLANTFVADADVRQLLLPASSVPQQWSGNCGCPSLTALDVSNTRVADVAALLRLATAGGTSAPCVAACGGDGGGVGGWTKQQQSSHGLTRSLAIRG